MKRITFTQPLFEEPELKVRNNRDDLIRQIVNRTDTKDKKKLARRIAVTANMFKWSNMDLHALLNKYSEVNNYSAFVNYCLKQKTI
jgi:hypothetical protein